MAKTNYETFLLTYDKIIIMISYTPFYKTIDKRKISQYQLINDFFIPAGTIQRIRNNESITLKSLDELCKILKCNVSDIVSII